MKRKLVMLVVRPRVSQSGKPPRAAIPIVGLAVAVGALLALPLSLHFEGNDGTAEPFLVVLPIAAAAAVFAAVSARRMHGTTLFVLNALAAAAAVGWWVALLTYEGD